MRQTNAKSGGGIADPFVLHRPGGASGAAGPLVVSSPHSGRNYTSQFMAMSGLDASTLRLSEDSFVDELFAAAPRHGAALIAATYPRAYIDVNREPLELDPRMFIDPLPVEANSTSDRVAAGLGTIARVVATGLNIYDRKLLFAEEAARIDAIYWPYHAALRGLIEDARARFGHAILIDCHSMPSAQSGHWPPPGRRAPAEKNRRARSDHRNPDPDFVLGDRFGTSCAGRLTMRIEELLCGMGYSVVRNDPYAGGYCTIRYGDPRAGVHAIQIEANRRLYMDEKRIRRRKGAMRRLAGDMNRLIGALAELDLAGEHRLAAE